MLWNAIQQSIKQSHQHDTERPVTTGRMVTEYVSSIKNTLRELQEPVWRGACTH
jgi:hypothetical protein